MQSMDELYTNMALELRRGTIVLAILSKLEKPYYGYALLSALEEKGIPVDAGTLYPLLRRLEKQGILGSTWDTSDVRPRKYYLLSQKGKELYDRLRAEWTETNDIVTKIMKEK